MVNFYSVYFFLSPGDLQIAVYFNFITRLSFLLFKPRLPFSLRCLVIRTKKILPRFVKKVLFSLSGRKSPKAKLCKERGGSKDLPLESCLI